MQHWLVFATAALLAYGSLLWEHGCHLWSRDHFQFFPVYVVTVVLLTAKNVREADFPQAGTWRVEPATCGIALLALVGSMWFWSPWLGAVSLLLLGNSLLNHFPDARRFWRLLVILIPLPLGLDEQLVHKLQLMSSVRASSLLDFLNVPHLMRGNVLELSEKRLFVEEACSGISSVYLLMAATLLFVALFEVRLIRSVPLQVSVVWWALIGNVCRIVAIAVAHAWRQVDLTTGWPHEVLGIVTLLLPLAGIASTKALIDFFLQSIGDDRQLDSENSTQALTATSLWNILTTVNRSLVYRSRSSQLAFIVGRRRMLNGLTMGLFGAAALYWGTLAAMAMHMSETPSSVSEASSGPSTRSAFVPALNRGTFDGIPGLRVDAFRTDERYRDHVSAAHVRPLAAWSFTAPAVQGTISILGPVPDAERTFPEAIEESWKFQETNTQSIPGHNSGGRMSMASLVNAAGQRARLYTCFLRSSGELVKRIQEDPTAGLATRLRSQLDLAATKRPGEAYWHLCLLTQPQTGVPVASELAAERHLFGLVLSALQRHWTSRTSPSETAQQSILRNAAEELGPPASGTPVVRISQVPDPPNDEPER
ncbi:MAG: exosortase/archaeosortase family protein [Planctomycetaceae bacterium]